MSRTMYAHDKQAHIEHLDDVNPCYSARVLALLLQQTETEAGRTRKLVFALAEASLQVSAELGKEHARVTR